MPPFCRSVGVPRTCVRTVIEKMAITNVRLQPLKGNLGLASVKRPHILRR
jgi:hypothetical protein